jgi:hypothetical protein
VTEPFTEGYRFRRDEAEEALHRKRIEAMERLANLARRPDPILKRPQPGTHFVGSVTDSE